MEANIVNLFPYSSFPQLHSWIDVFVCILLQFNIVRGRVASDVLPIVEMTSMQGTVEGCRVQWSADVAMFAVNQWPPSACLPQAL